MDQRNQGQDHVGTSTGVGALPSAQNIGLNGNVPAFDQGLLQTTNSDAMAAMMGAQPFIQDHALSGDALPVGDPSYLMPMMMANGGPIGIPPNTVSADDVALYDRQIRLWGMAAQQKIQNAHILLVTMRGLAHEVAKNLVLAGVGSVTLLDGSPVAEADLGCQFFLSEGGESLVGQNRAEAASHALRKLNPRVQVHVDPESVTAKGPSYFAAYDVVIATDLGPDTFNIINTATRINGRPFYAAGTHGMYGFIFSDLIEHDFVIEREASNVATTPKQESRTRSIVDVKTKTEGNKTIESVTKRELYSTWFLASDVAVLPPEYTTSKRRLRFVTPALSCLRALWEFKQLQGGRLPSNRDDLKLFTQIATQKHKALSLPSETLKPEFLRSFLQNLGSEIAPVTAILGGQLAQDVINVLGQSQQPIQNMVVFDGTTMEALMYPLHPELDLGASLLSVPNAGAQSTPDTGAGVTTNDVSLFGTNDAAMYQDMANMPVNNIDMSSTVAMHSAPIQQPTPTPARPQVQAHAVPAPPSTQQSEDDHPQEGKQELQQPTTDTYLPPSASEAPKGQPPS
ncbi:hypothetical protein C2857_004915 [Epichloe festucae Fl1]|uniref:Ubiquitin-like 1-activating enzyme E1A n=1 Tax=Epichloe festucae (strain Fl1) TaxID=877507 RepID=A0A7U3SMY1_EPIFF|nr:hypothetical protein C2857_004915 [Epichloe festucae Fl1]